MSKGNSRYFSGTSGANADKTTNATAKGVKDTKVAAIYSETDTLRNHIENVEGVSGTGVVGAHNKESFMDAVRENNILIENTFPNSQIDGVEKLHTRFRQRIRRDGLQVSINRKHFPKPFMILQKSVQMTISPEDWRLLIMLHQNQLRDE